MKPPFWIVFGILVLLHHDFWWWSDPTIIFNFLPIGLAYHAGFSLAAAAFWLAVVKYSWPVDVENGE